VWLLLGCAQTEYTPVDRLVDVIAEIPDAASSVRLCAADGPNLEAAFTDGRWALAGVPEDVVPAITLDVLDADRLRWRAGPVDVDAAEVDTTLESCEDCDPCVASGRVPPREEASWVVGVRFLSP
jgi:hypothetical protein